MGVGGEALNKLFNMKTSDPQPLVLVSIKQSKNVGTSP